MLIVGGLYTILVIGLNLLMGYAGQVSLGHAAFYGLSAYTTGILTGTYHWPVSAGIAAALALSTLVAYLIAVPTLKLRGNYLAMGTLGFGIIVYIVFNEATALTGGPSGFTGIPKLSVAGKVFSSDREYYYVVWGTVLLLFALSQNLVRSGMGRALRAIHTSETAAVGAGGRHAAIQDLRLRPLRVLRGRGGGAVRPLRDLRLPRAPSVSPPPSCWSRWWSWGGWRRCGGRSSGRSSSRSCRKRCGRSRTSTS